MKNITLAGRLTKDAELRHLNNGDPVANFSVAVDDRSGGEKKGLFFEASLFGKRGEALAPHLVKGASVTIAGDFGTREYNGKTYLTVRVNDVTLQGGKPSSEGSFSGGRDDRISGGGGGGDHSQSGGRGHRETYDLNDDLDSIPF